MPSSRRPAADEVESSIAAAEARLQEIAYSRVSDETARRRASLKRKLAVREAETRLALLRTGSSVIPGSFLPTPARSSIC